VIADYDDLALIKPHVLIEELNRADVIYGHNIFGFDLLALAHHHGADYDALAAKAVDTMVLARLVDPPMAKGMPNGYYSLDAVAQRLGHTGKTDDLKGLAKRYGGFDQIPVDSREYQDYLRGDLAATKAVYEGLRMLRMGDGGDSPSNAAIAYAEREMKVVALQNRMTLNGWAVDPELLAERVAHEDAQRAAAVEILNRDYGVPLAPPDRFKLKPKAEWPIGIGARNVSVAVARRYVSLFPEAAVEHDLAERIPGESHKAPWATDAGRTALEAAFTAAGAPYAPRTKTGALALSGDALGDEPWYDKASGKSVPGLLQVFGDIPEVRRLVETILLATGARAKYAEIQKFVTDAGRVHAWIGDAQGSGRWAMTRPSITNIGIRGAAKEERAVLVADPGHVLVTVDASQVDMRAVAALSQDPAYMELFQPGRDAHMEMAEVYFGVGNAETRQRTKAINHKFNYGGGVKSTAEMNRVPVEVVQQAYEARLAAYPRVAEWLAEVRETAAAGVLLDNGFGRMMRPNPERAHTQGPALMGQGAARDIVCESLLRLVKARPDVTPYLRGVVHDELVLSVPADSVEEWQAELERAFTWEWKGVPILCEVGTPAYRWSDCK
jgi:DNA polymerase-1